MLTVLVSTISNSQIFFWKNVSSFCKCKNYSYFFSRNISIYAILDDQRFNDTLTNDILSFEQLGPGLVAFEKVGGLGECSNWSRSVFACVMRLFACRSRVLLNISIWTVIFSMCPFCNKSGTHYHSNRQSFLFSVFRNKKGKKKDIYISG